MYWLARNKCTTSPGWSWAFLTGVDAGFAVHGKTGGQWITDYVRDCRTSGGAEAQSACPALHCTWLVGATALNLPSPISLKHRYPIRIR